MLIKNLSRILFAGAIIASVYGTITIWSEAAQKPFVFSLFGSPKLWLTRPGMEASTIRTNTGESRLRDTLFAAKNALETSDQLPEYTPNYKVNQGRHIDENLWIEAIGTEQRLGFIFYDLLLWSCIAWLLFLLSRLFMQFHRREYFTKRTITLLHHSSWLLLTPQIAALILYWLFLAGLHPVRMLVGNEQGTKIIARYELQAGIQWELCLVAVGMLVLTYIFREGVRMKKLEELTL